MHGRAHLVRETDPITQFVEVKLERIQPVNRDRPWCQRSSRAVQNFNQNQALNNVYQNGKHVSIGVTFSGSWLTKNFGPLPTHDCGRRESEKLTKIILGSQSRQQPLALTHQSHHHHQLRDLGHAPQYATDDDLFANIQGISPLPM